MCVGVWYRYITLHFEIKILKCLEEMHRYIYTKMQQACSKNKLTLEETKL